MSTSNSSLEPAVPEWLGPREWVLERIQTETGRVGTRAYALIRELSELHPSLRAELLTWWKDGKIDEHRQVHGWSLRRIIEAGSARYPSEALTWLSHLMIEPEKHLAALERPHSLVLGGGLTVPPKTVVQ